MRSIRASRNRLGAFALVCLGLARVVAACASEDDAPGAPSIADASPDVAVNLLDSSAASDATSSVDPDAPYDAGPPLVVACAQEPCATALTALYAFCALLDNGRVACWGFNEFYDLGRGVEAGLNNDINPQYVPGVENAVSMRGSCAIDDGGVAKCWGRGNFLQSVDGGPPPQNSNLAASPVTVPLPPVRTIGTANQFENAGGCAGLVSGALVCWGYQTGNTFGLLDAGGTAYQNYTVTSPTPVTLPSGAGAPIEITVGGATFIRDDKGGTFSFGDQHVIGRVSSLSLDPYPSPLSVNEISALANDSYDVCAVSRGRVYCWGTLPTGPLEKAVPTEILLDDPAVRVATKSPFACAVTNKKELWCWGSDTNGRLGNGTLVTVSLAPVKVDLPGPVVDVELTSTDACALLETGQVYCWGTMFSTKTPKPVVLP